MSILVVDLTDGLFSTMSTPEESGLELAIKLYKSFEGKAVVMSSPTSKSVRYPGSTNSTIVYHSPISDRMEFTYSNQSPGFSLYKLGYEALVIKGRASRLSYISIYSGNNEIYICEQLRGAGAGFPSIAGKSLNDAFIYTSKAADNGVRFASVISNQKPIPGAGIGFVFASMNLKGIVFQGFFRKDDLANDKETMHFVHGVESSRFARRIRRNGANCFIDDAQRLGWLPVRNYTSRFDPRAYSLDGISFVAAYGNYPDSCQECFLACGRRRKDNSILPSWQECMALGTNLGFFDPRSVSRLVSVAISEGLDIIHLGAILAYVSSLDESNLEVLSMSGKSVEEYENLIHSIAESRGVGAIFRDGLKGFPDAIQSTHSQAILVDLRGSFTSAITTSLGLDLILPAGLVIPRKDLNPKCAAILAYYELVYTLALLSFGFGPLVTTCIYWDKIPQFAFSCPTLLRHIVQKFSVYGIKNEVLMGTGMRILDQLDLSFGAIPSYFEMSGDSAKDFRTVPMARLQEYFYYEKSIAERILKSRRDTRRNPNGKISPAEGPDDDLGRDGEPGLNK